MSSGGNGPILAFSLDLEPVPWQRPRASPSGGFHFHTAKKPKAFCKAVTAIAAASYQGSEPAKGALIVSLLFVRSRPQRLQRKKDDAGLIPCDTKPDIDNLAKGVLDGLNKSGVWGDDAQVSSLLVRKRWAEKGQGPRVEVTVWREVDAR